MDICFWNKCNNRCAMCTNPKDFWESNIYTREFLEARLKGIKDELEENDSILLTGGEPTIHPEFLDILRFVRMEYSIRRIDLLSNGRRFFYSNFAKEVMKTPNLTIAVALHGFNSATHDAVTRSAGSFSQTVGGIKNLLAEKKPQLNQIVEIRVVINRLNYKDLQEILKFIKVRFSDVDRVVLIFIEVEGQGKDNFKTIGLAYKEFGPYFEKIEPFLKAFRELRLYHFPLCVMPLKFWPYAWRTLPAYEIQFLAKCEKCVYKEQCLGVHKGYLETVGEREFKPIREKNGLKLSGNSFSPFLI